MTRALTSYTHALCHRPLKTLKINLIHRKLNAGLMFDQRRRRSSNSKPALTQRAVFSC